MLHMQRGVFQEFLCSQPQLGEICVKCVGRAEDKVVADLVNALFAGYFIDDEHSILINIINIIINLINFQFNIENILTQ